MSENILVVEYEPRYTDRVKAAHGVTLINIGELRLLTGKIHILNVLLSKLNDRARLRAPHKGLSGPQFMAAR